HVATRLAISTGFHSISPVSALLGRDTVAPPKAIAYVGSVDGSSSASDESRSREPNFGPVSYHLPNNGGEALPKKVPELSDLQVRRLSKRAGFWNVGGVPGLYLDTKPPAASWILRVKVGSKRRDIGLGGYPDVTLAQAREKAREARRQIEQGIDPVEARKAAKAALLAAQAKAITFEQAARKCQAARVHEFRNEKHKKDWITSLELYAFPLIGRLPVADVEQAHAVAVLGPIWTTKTETATRVRQRCETVLEWARLAGYRNGNGDNPFRW